MAILELYKNLIVFSIILIVVFMIVYYFKSVFTFDHTLGIDYTESDSSD
jgi:uncharacterized membrane protein